MKTVTILTKSLSPSFGVQNAAVTYLKGIASEVRLQTPRGWRRVQTSSAAWDRALEKSNKIFTGPISNSRKS